MGGAMVDEYTPVSIGRIDEIIRQFDEEMRGTVLSINSFIT